MTIVSFAGWPKQRDDDAKRRFRFIMRLRRDEQVRTPAPVSLPTLACLRDAEQGALAQDRRPPK
jgi:hypothetical protein